MRISIKHFIKVRKHFTVEIVARGEGLIYKDDDYTINFDCGYNSKLKRFEIDLYHYSDINFHKFEVPEDKLNLIIKNITEHFKKKNVETYFNTIEPITPLKSVDELLDERLYQRDHQN